MNVHGSWGITHHHAASHRPHGPPDVSGGPDDFAWRALEKATDKKRSDLLADIVSHPKGAPSVEELDYMNPNLSEAAIRRHLQVLEDVDVITRSELEAGERLWDYPYQFYSLTDAAHELFDRNGLFPKEAWQRQYQSVTKTERITDLKRMPRPD